MLDENLPTFIFRPMPDHPSSAVVYYTRSGSDPAPEYIFRLADPVSKPACRGVYAAALTDPYNSNDVVYGEVAVKPEWQQPTLSAAELREQRERGPDASGAAPTPRIPDAFVIQLYNPDQSVTVRWTPKTWNKSESWEFEMPIETFRMPSASRLDRGSADDGEGYGPAGTLNDTFAPKNGFRWKRDGRLGNKDMTCFMLGRTVDYHAPSDKQSSSNRRKEPDITVALVKHGRDPAVTIYEPNLQRVEVQDRKGLELVLLLGAQVIRDLYVVPRADAFNIEGAAAAAGAAGRRRKNSRTATMSMVGPPAGYSGPGGPSNNASSPVAGAPPRRPSSVYMTGAMPSGGPITSAAAIPNTSAPARTGAPGAPWTAPGSVPSAAAIEEETRRLQTMLEREERERQKREKEEERRIKKMLEAEEVEQRKREAEIAKETERLRKLYGTDGQDLPSAVPPPPPGPPPSSVSYNRPVPPPPPPIKNSSPHSYGYANNNHPTLPPRPVSTGPSTWQGGSGNSSNNGHGRNRKSSGGFLSNPAASVSGFFSSSSSTSRIQKKRSVHF
ncbi:hypothetical protein F503_07969 [Ophiostoma piceae UAMH 11346]|uniref:Uncharacterized protein n=1 Tax=Ophiostoma piceae (strain UAMH 11346) TaxID=1262450 RepID=S3CLD5_OPHP1|nr:hypothetical protein F503_07969 [Ophiostoma piceae UAMH 11346]